MLKIYFGEWGTGRLQRLQYLGYYLLLILIMVLLIAGLVVSMGLFENMASGDIAATQEAIMDKLGIPFVIAIALFFFAMFLANINILAKRIRDMGLPPVWTILGLIAVSMLLGYLFPGEKVAVDAMIAQTGDGNTSTIAAAGEVTTQSPAIQIYDTIVFLCLLLIPSDTFKSKGY